MSDLSNLHPAGSSKDRKRIGRGPGSTWGKTAGKGHKGQNARSGGGVRPGYEGGQMPLNRRLPKRGFRNIFRTELEVVNLGQLERFDAGSNIDVAELVAAGLVRKNNAGVKLLANGELTKALTIKVDKCSKAALEKVTAAGGTVEVLSGR